MKIYLLAFLPFIALTGCKREGCTDITAINYDADAKKDDGSCTYTYGCTDPLADNYNESATKDDGSCTFDNQGFVKIIFVPRFNGTAFGLRENRVNIENIAFRFTDFLFYVSDVKATSSGASPKLLSEVELINFDKPLSMSYVYPLTQGTYTGLTLRQGLSAEQNATNPNTQDAESPLSVYSTMFWNVSLKYLFVKIEGLFDGDTDPTTYETSMIYHLGNDAFGLDIASLNRSFTVVRKDTVEYPIYLNVDRLFYNTSDTLRLKTERETQTVDNMPLAVKVNNLFSGIFSTP